MADTKRMLTTAFVLPTDLRDLLRSAAAARSLANPARRVSMSDVAREILESRRSELETEVRRVLGPGALTEDPPEPEPEPASPSRRPRRKAGA